MRSINKVIIIGNLTRDPELRQTPNGQNVATFGVATNREWMTRDGDRKNSAEFHECVAWAHLAEICSKRLKKGHLVYVEGYLKTRSWESTDNVKKFKTEVVVQDMIILEKGPRDEEETTNFNSSQEDSTLGPIAMTVTTPLVSDSFNSPITTVTETSQTSYAPSSFSTVSENKVEETTPESGQAPVVSALEENPIDKDLGL